MRWHLGLVLAVAVAAAAGCGRSLNGPEERLTGTWAARGSGHTGMGFVLRIEQSGRTITGTACAGDGGMLLFSDVPVHGSYPEVGFTVVTPASVTACCPASRSQRFSGRQDGTGDIVGTFDGTLDLRFVRGANGVC
jgi:hypothetical protein